MSEKFVLNETSYFGKGAREELATEIKNRGFKKVFLVSDKSLVEAGVTAKVEEVLNNAGIRYDLYGPWQSKESAPRLRASADPQGRVCQSHRRGKGLPHHRQCPAHAGQGVHR